MRGMRSRSTRGEWFGGLLSVLLPLPLPPTDALQGSHADPWGLPPPQTPRTALIRFLRNYESAAIKTADSLAFLNAGQNIIFSASLSAAMVMAAQVMTPHGPPSHDPAK